ncbi:hypothetical protein DENSPDRAFT_867330 [Dentipellis sp. KUC8613]|nr:hypothetical protein DENSPDRAFT_867330 [Dentipellis sp. KUC8613]
MNNLLRSLAGSQVNSSLPEADLKLLLQTVKDGRKQSHDPKLGDPFYDALEDLLHDLRSVTMDNHDAEAFLKPVSRTDAPDYYDVIANPMDLQTMLKKVKQKHYKSKKEFKDDLDLIWSNCWTYNATEGHPLRMCATRLKAKAERLLKHITDRKERADPHIPTDLSVSIRRPQPKANGINGHYSSITPSSTPPIPHRPTTTANSKRTSPFITPASTPQRRELPFAELPALVRTAQGMTAFRELDQALDTAINAPPGQQPSTSASMEEKLRELAGLQDAQSDADSPDSADGDLGDKRKLNGIADRPRKRIRYTPNSVPTDPVELWWAAQQSDTMLANSLPPLPSVPTSGPSKPPSAGPSHPPPKRKKKKPPTAVPRPNSLLGLMNNNIRTLRRVRQTNVKFAALTASMGAQNAGADEAGGADVSGGGGGRGGGMLDTPMMDVDEPKVEAELDEKPWHLPGSKHDSGIDIGEEGADQCMHWMNQKVLEHNGFQGSSKMALDVLSSISSEYLMNIGRTFRFYIDKHSNSMTPEEIILHTLFEGGITRVQELERYVKDDVVRHGNRILDLEKKIVNAYEELASTEAPDDDALFGNEDDEEEESAFVMGQFTEDIGEDFLGLRELGIAAELGLSNLSIPKKLLKGKHKAKNASAIAKPTEPPPPYPPPPPFIPLDSTNVDNQIGLLKPYYHQRLAAYASAHPPPPAPYPGAPPPPAPVLVLPDDPPNPAQSKIGPLGQVLKTSPSAGTTKKKQKGKDAGAGAGAKLPDLPLAAMYTLSPKAESDVEVPMSPKKKPAASGAGGTGTGKKRGRPPANPNPNPNLPSVVLASA